MNRLHALTTHISPAAAGEEHVPGTSATYEVVDHVGETADAYHLSSLLRPHPTPLPLGARVAAAGRPDRQRCRGLTGATASGSDHHAEPAGQPQLHDAGPAAGLRRRDRADQGGPRSALRDHHGERLLVLRGRRLPQPREHRRHRALHVALGEVALQHVRPLRQGARHRGPHHCGNERPRHRRRPRPRPRLRHARRQLPVAV